MDFHKEYKLEHEGVEILETSYGFAVYRFFPEHVNLMELYVTPDERGKGKAQELVSMVKELAQAEKVNKMVSMIDLTTEAGQAAAGALVAAGLVKGDKVSVTLDSYAGDLCRG